MQQTETEAGVLTIEGEIHTIIEYSPACWLIINECGELWCSGDLSLDYAVVRLLACAAFTEE